MNMNTSNTYLLHIGHQVKHGRRWLGSVFDTLLPQVVATDLFLHKVQVLHALVALRQLTVVDHRFLACLYERIRGIDLDNQNNMGVLLELRENEVI